mgnify:CR=1 FL=1
MNVTEAIRNRRSIRKFQQGVQIPQEDLDLILEAAMMAPSARNTRPWEFVVVENREILEKFRDIQPYTGMMKTASLVWTSGTPGRRKRVLAPGLWSRH